MIIGEIFGFRTKDYDVALLELATPIVDVKPYSPACLPDYTSNLTLFEGMEGYVAGWGLNGSDVGGKFENFD